MTSRNWLKDLLLEFKQVFAAHLTVQHDAYMRGRTEHRYKKTCTTPKTTFTVVSETNASAGIQLPNPRTFRAVKSFGGDVGVKNEKSNLFASSTPSWCTLVLNQAAIEATEIEAQLLLQLRLATRHRASQDRQILAEHRVVSAFVVHLCLETQNWFLETERRKDSLDLVCGTLVGSSFLKWPSWSPDATRKMLSPLTRPRGAKAKCSQTHLAHDKNSGPLFCS